MLKVFFAFLSLSLSQAQEINWDDVTIKEIYLRGNRIQATVVADPGIAFTSKKTQLNNACELELKKYIEPVILKKDRVIDFEQLTSQKRKIISEKDASIAFLAFFGSDFTTLSTLKKTCGNLIEFSVVDNTENLKEVSLPSDSPQTAL